MVRVNECGSGHGELLQGILGKPHCYSDVEQKLAGSEKLNWEDIWGQSVPGLLCCNYLLSFPHKSVSNASTTIMNMSVWW